MNAKELVQPFSPRGGQPGLPARVVLALRKRLRIYFTSRPAIRRYLETHAVKKLQIGSGDHVLGGWLNSDLRPPVPGVVYLNTVRRFPFEDGMFDYVFSEHMIEHIPYAQGKAMLRECFRILKPGGRIRIVTPDLRFLINLYPSCRTRLQENYIKWATDEFVRGADGYEAAFVINNYVRDWGHQFIYDPTVLRLALTQAGFADIAERELNQSDDEHLRGLEHAERMPAGFLALESMVFEARKP